MTRPHPWIWIKIRWTRHKISRVVSYMRFLNQAMAYRLTRPQVKQFRGAVAAGHLPWDQLCDQIAVVNKIKIRRAKATRLESMVQGLLAANQRLEKEVHVLRERNNKEEAPNGVHQV